MRRDGLDPGFAANLSKLGPVRIHDAGRFMRTPAPAQRTLNARWDVYNRDQPAGQLSISAVDALFDRIKSMPKGASRAEVYKEYGVDGRTMDEVRRWVNNPSVGGEVEVNMVDGEEVREMQVSCSHLFGDGPSSRHPQPSIGKDSRGRGKSATCQSCCNSEGGKQQGKHVPCHLIFRNGRWQARATGRVSSRSKEGQGEGPHTNP